MIALSEILIVTFCFGIAGLYLFFVSLFIRKAERETVEADRAERRSMAA